LGCIRDTFCDTTPFFSFGSSNARPPIYMDLSIQSHQDVCVVEPVRPSTESGKGPTVVHCTIFTTACTRKDNGALARFALPFASGAYVVTDVIRNSCPPEIGSFVSSTISQWRTCFPGLRPKATRLELDARKISSAEMSIAKATLQLTRRYWHHGASTHLPGPCYELRRGDVNTAR
jgi:hypothetical protein